MNEHILSFLLLSQALIFIQYYRPSYFMQRYADEDYVAVWLVEILLFVRSYL